MAAGFRMRYLGGRCPESLTFCTGQLFPQNLGSPADSIPHQGHLGSLCSLYPPLPEVSIEDTVGEAFPTDADALQHAIAAQLVHDQWVVHHPCSSGEERGVSLRENEPIAFLRLDSSAWLTWSLPLIGDDAPHEVRVGGLQVGHQLVQILLGMGERRESGATGTNPLVSEP